MATVRNKVVYEADVGNLMRGLDRIEKQTQSIQDTFQGLKSAIAGIAVGAFIQDTLNASIAIKRMSDATGIATQTLYGFSQAMVAAGGTSDQALDGISDLTKNMGDAAAGSGELQKAFALVGVILS